MELCCLVPLASVGGAGRGLSGSTATLPKPPTRSSAKLGCRLRLELWMPNGYRKKVLSWHQTRVNRRFQSNNQHITSPDILVSRWTPTVTLQELWNCGNWQRMSVCWWIASLNMTMTTLWPRSAQLLDPAVLSPAAWTVGEAFTITAEPFRQPCQL